MELPNRLGELASRFGGGVSAETLIDQHTLAPYYAAFAPQDARRRLYEGMTGSVTGVYVAAGVAAFRSGGMGRLRFCPDCLGEMAAEWGDWHWRRDQQLPGVLVCPTHGTVLREAAVEPHRRNRHEYVAASPTTCPPDAPPVVDFCDSARLGTLRRVAEASAALLDVRVGPADFAEITTYYRQELQRAGLMRSMRMVDQARLRDTFHARFDGVLHVLPGLLSETGLRGGWLESLTRRQRKVVHPLEHVLLRDLLASRSQGGRTLVGPWPCRNPLAAHDGEPVVEDLRVYRNRGSRIGVFACSCGYSYTRSIDAHDRLGPARFRNYGALLAPALSRMVAEGRSLRCIATTLRVDPKTVATLALRAGIPTPWSLKPSSTAPGRMSVAPESLPSPEPPRRSARPSARRDWKAIDVDVRCRIETAADDLRRIVPPVRLTASSLQRNALGARDWVTKRRSKLPLASEMLAATIETVSAFQLRRIAHCIDTIDAADDGKAWRIMRRAGLRADALPLVERLLALRTASGGDGSTRR